MSVAYTYVPPGLPAELGHLDLDEVVAHLHNHLGNFLLDPAVTSVYLNRLGTDPGLGASPAALRTLAYLAGKYAQFEPFERNGLGIVLNFRDDAVLRARRDLLVQAGFWEQFGFDYYGPIDGHDIEVLESTLHSVQHFTGKPR